MKFNNVGIIVKPILDAVSETATQVDAFLREKGCTVYLDSSTDGIIEQDSSKALSREQIGERCDLVIVIGGDGTFLNAARSLAVADVSLIGINIGRLAFLLMYLQMIYTAALNSYSPVSFRKKNASY